MGVQSPVAAPLTSALAAPYRNPCLVSKTAWDQTGLPFGNPGPRGHHGGTSECPDSATLHSTPRQVPNYSASRYHRTVI